VLTVFDPFPVLTVTIESRDDQDELHLHAGGQGVWIGRMASSLGASVRLVCAAGGETGDVLARLVATEGIDLRSVASGADVASYVHDRRSGGREELAIVSPPPLARHELDELYELALVEGCDADSFVLAGPRPGTVLPEGTYERLAADVASVQPHLVVDLSGDALEEALAAGVIEVLKISHEELIDGGYAPDDSAAAIVGGIEALRERGARNVVVSRGPDTTLASVRGDLVEVVTPTFRPNDSGGGGDAMTAALAVGLARGDSLEESLRLGAAAGALNVTRRGLASVQPDHVRRLKDRVELRPVALEVEARSCG
jgi:1-phosphofructokinase